MNSDLIAAIVVVALIFGTKTGRDASSRMWRTAGGPTRKQMRAKASRWARKAPPLALRAGKSAGRTSLAGARSAGGWVKAKSKPLRGRVWRWAYRPELYTAPTPEQRTEHDPPQEWFDARDARLNAAADARESQAKDAEATAPADSPKETPDSPPEATKESTVDTEYELPSSDGEFLEFCQELARSCRTLADAVEEHSSALMSLGLSRSVTAHVEAIAQLFAEAAQQARATAVEFESVYEEPRAIAAKGMHFRGEDAA